MSSECLSFKMDHFSKGIKKNENNFMNIPESYEFSKWLPLYVTVLHKYLDTYYIINDGKMTFQPFCMLPNPDKTGRERFLVGNPQD